VVTLLSPLRLSRFVARVCRVPVTGSSGPVALPREAFRRARVARLGAFFMITKTFAPENGVKPFAIMVRAGSVSRGV